MSKQDAEVEDFLTEDPEISSQKFVLLSFLSPEKILSNKDLFFFSEFLKDYEVQWRTTRLEAWLAQQVSDINTRLEKLAGSFESRTAAADLSGASQEIRGNLLRADRLVEEFQQHVRKSLKESDTSVLKDAFEDFVFKNGTRLEDAFFQKNDFRTTIRGIKVRGVFASDGEAAARAKRLQKSDPNVDILMGAVGKWMAWDPNPNSGIKSEYANEQLNTLMKKYQENEESREQFYSEQKKKRMGTAKTLNEAVAEDTTSVTAQQDLSATPFGGSSAAAGSYGGMFDGHPDLAIARKTGGADGNV